MCGVTTLLHDARVTAVRDIPVSDVDLFADDARVDPYPIYRELRDAGPVVEMARHGHYALPRYADVRAALMDWRTFSSARSVFVDEETNRTLEGITLCSDPPDHTMMRSVLGRPLRPDRMREIAPTIAAEADRVVDRVVGAGRFDAVADLAEHLPMAVVSTLVGLGEEYRGKLLEWAAAIWDVQGPVISGSSTPGPRSASSCPSRRTTPCPDGSTRTAGRPTSTRRPTAARCRARSAR